MKKNNAGNVWARERVSRAAKARNSAKIELERAKAKLQEAEENLPPPAFYSRAQALRSQFNSKTWMVLSPIWLVDIIGKRLPNNVYYEVFNSLTSFLHIPYDDKFHRYYLASFVGSIATAAVIGLQEQKKPHDLRNALLKTGAGLSLFEAFSSVAPNRSFDWGDMASYALGLTLYTAGALYASRKEAPSPKITHPKAYIDPSGLS